MEVVTEELAGEHRLFGIRDCDKTFCHSFLFVYSFFNLCMAIIDNINEKLFKWLFKKLESNGMIERLEDKRK
ncbi:hypothetical protein EFP6CSP_16125 [Enterococcus faecium]|nr:hypothetical protein EFP6CSP_16125 [Enterococcus faecium]